MYPPPSLDDRGRQADEIRRGQQAAGLTERRAGGQPRRHRREDVPAVEGRGHGLPMPVRLRQLDRLGDAAEHVRGRQQQTIVRTDEQTAVGGERDRPT